MDKYHLALGRFIEAFANTEHWLTRVLWDIAKVDEPTGRAIFSGTRASGAIPFIRRIHEARNATLEANLQRAFEQLATINTMRDRVVHWGLSVEGTALFDAQLVVSNKHIAHSPDKLLSFPISDGILDDMTADLVTIIHAFRVHLISQWEDTDVKAELLRGQAQIALAPWRYRSSAPASNPGKSRKATRKQLRQQPPSQE